MFYMMSIDKKLTDYRFEYRDIRMNNKGINPIEDIETV